MDYTLALMTGVDIPIPELGLTMHQPRIKEISMMGERDYFASSQLVCINKEKLMAQQGQLDLQNLTNFQIFMAMVVNSESQNKQKNMDNICQVFSLLFPDYKTQFLQTGIVLTNPAAKHLVTINETNFDIFSSAIQQVVGMQSSGGGNDFNPHGQLASRIAAKLERGRQIVNKQKNGGGGQGSILGRYVSILTVALESMSLEDCLNLTTYQLFDLMNRYSLYSAWDIDIRSRLAGGKPDKEPDDWMKNLH